MTSTNSLDVIHAYRRLYRCLLHAVQYATPARYVARDQLRSAFRTPGATLDPRGVKRTVWFLQAAAKETGLEHHILKNLLWVRSVQNGQSVDWKARVHQRQSKKSPMKDEEISAQRHYEMTIAMLNKTMGLCPPATWTPYQIQLPEPVPSFSPWPSPMMHQSKRFGPEMGDESQIWRLGGCLLMT
ncbi:hypothetical protein XA68_17853 [Ophiocordyceps unilateralis]|uniref:Uncharacterized protein n=1 Tax=Ophiocordyceps unilateralis TaxID=268505 RepID=A0A2A9P2W5_OPHUN|nr:hypothetical protein XA68_17853 [Ophiocordyceps unilateralis]